MSVNGALPSGYQAVNCLKITSATGSYIDLNLAVSWGHKIVMDLEPTLYSSNWTTIACSSVNSANYRFYYSSEGMVPSAIVGIRMSQPNTGINSSSGRSTGLNQQRRTFIMTHRTNRLSIQVTDIPTLNYGGTPSYAPANTGVWRLYSQGVGSDRYRGKIYSTQIYDVNDELIVDLVPCLNLTTNKAGMYDLINQVFYPKTAGDDFQYEI